MTPAAFCAAYSHVAANRSLGDFPFCFWFPSVATEAANLTEARVSQVIRDVKLLPPQVRAHGRRAEVSRPVKDGTAVRTGVESRAELTFTDQHSGRLGGEHDLHLQRRNPRSRTRGRRDASARSPKTAGRSQDQNLPWLRRRSPAPRSCWSTTPDAYIKFIILEGHRTDISQRPRG